VWYYGLAFFTCRKKNRWRDDEMEEIKNVRIQNNYILIYSKSYFFSSFPLTFLHYFLAKQTLFDPVCYSTRPSKLFFYFFQPTWIFLVSFQNLQLLNLCVPSIFMIILLILILNYAIGCRLLSTLEGKR
jgi:hypothetical protein